MGNLYLERYAWPGPVIEEEPDAGIGLAVVIPCLGEPHIVRTLEHLEACDLPPCAVEVLVVVNHSSEAPEAVRHFNAATCRMLRAWSARHSRPGIRYHALYAPDLPVRSAGVGLARKIGMDEAVRRFEAAGSRKGILLCLDADCTCSTNYLRAVHRAFAEDPAVAAGLVHFEHIYQDAENHRLRRSVVDYELHLRYHVASLRLAGYPYPFHTVGSCMAVRSDIYQAQGGMNRRKAGEDFYFLHKIFPHGRTVRINGAVVYPGVRCSQRVPFGTGATLTRLQQSGSESLRTYHRNSYLDLKAIFSHPEKLFIAGLNRTAISERWPESLQAFLRGKDADALLQGFSVQAKSAKVFRDRLFRWFDGLKTLKFLHFARDHFYPDLEVESAVREFLICETDIGEVAGGREELLEVFRKYELGSS
jgi:hypothetical protein